MITHKSRLFFSIVPLSMLAAALAIGASSSVTGCGSDGDTGGGADTCFDYSSFKSDSPEVHFKADVLPIFRTSCGLSTSCHGSQSNPPAPEQVYLGPKLKDPDPTQDQIDAIFEQSVNKDAFVNPDMKIIAPGDPEHSFLLYKIDGVSCSKLTCAKDDSCGTDMPPPSAKLIDADKRDTIRRWIAQGAKND